MRCDGCWLPVTSSSSPDLNAARKSVYETTGAAGAGAAGAGAAGAGAAGAFVRRAPDGSTADCGTNAAAVALKSEAESAKIEGSGRSLGCGPAIFPTT